MHFVLFTLREFLGQLVGWLSWPICFYNLWNNGDESSAMIGQVTVHYSSISASSVRHLITLQPSIVRKYVTNFVKNIKYSNLPLATQTGLSNVIKGSLFLRKNKYFDNVAWTLLDCEQSLFCCNVPGDKRKSERAQYTSGEATSRELCGRRPLVYQTCLLCPHGHYSKRERLLAVYNFV